MRNYFHAIVINLCLLEFGYATDTECGIDGTMEGGVEYQINDVNGTITDKKRQLMWTPCVFGRLKSDCADGSAKTLTWVEALNKARGLEFGGFTNWRMPRVEELITIVDPCAESPKVVEEFVGFPEGLVWTSSANIDYATDAWAVDFATGEAVISSRDEPRYVIFVRGLE